MPQNLPVVARYEQARARSVERREAEGMRRRERERGERTREAGSALPLHNQYRAAASTLSELESTPYHGLRADEGDRPVALEAYAADRQVDVDRRVVVDDPDSATSVENRVLADLRSQISEERARGRALKTDLERSRRQVEQLQDELAVAEEKQITVPTASDEVERLQRLLENANKEKARFRKQVVRQEDLIADLEDQIQTAQRGVKVDTNEQGGQKAGHGSMKKHADHGKTYVERKRKVSGESRTKIVKNSMEVKAPGFLHRIVGT